MISCLAGNEFFSRGLPYMLVASRDPSHPVAHDVSTSHGIASRFGRAMGAVQIIGTLLAIPVGIGSAITMYRANFSVETTCQSLRGNIVAMLDKSVDATARHMLVRRDVETFEGLCRTVDPDATAAFKALLAADKSAAPVAPAAARRIEPKPETVTRKAEPRLDAVTKEAPVKSSVAASGAASTQGDASDVIWVDAVRRALATPATDAPPVDVQVTAAKPLMPTELAKPAPVTQLPPALASVSRDVRRADEARTPTMTIAAPPPTAAPALPPATPLSIVPVRPAEDGHPVPPESIPDTVPVTKAESHAPSRLGALAARIPLVGWAFER
jgi:hypothetical protein